MSDSHSTPAATPDKPAGTQPGTGLQPPTTAAGKPVKPTKPNERFPLTAHPAGYWCKKIRGRIHYFGPWSDPDGALDNYLRQKDALHAGRLPRSEPEALTVKALCNRFLNDKKALVESGELTPRSWDEYEEAAKVVVKEFTGGRLVEDLGPDDFAALRRKMAKRWGPTRLGNVIQRVRSIFKYGMDNDLITRVVRYGSTFKRPSKKTLRVHKARQGPKLFTAEEVRRMIDAADMPLRAMIFLGTNCGFGMSDCGQLPVTTLDLEGGWHNFARPKTGAPRRCALWPETVAAVKEALEKRPRPKREEYAGLVFLTAQGRPWHKEDMSSPAVFKVRNLLKKLGINGRKGLGFYTLRHTFRTVADEAKDQPAADRIMGARPR
jgi:integrase